MEILTKEDMHYCGYEHVDRHEHNQGIELARAPVKGKQLQTAINNEGLIDQSCMT